MSDGALLQLSALLGVEILDVQQDRPGTWWLQFAEAPQYIHKFTSRAIRNPSQIKKYLFMRNARSLTKAQCRTALRLMHEVVEAKERTENKS
jgi:hypothetical protein